MKITSIIFGLLISTHVAAESDKQVKPVLSGKAYDTKTNTLIYKEEHHYEIVQGETVMNSTFTDVNGDTIAERVIEYQDHKVRSYKLKQEQINYQESITRNNSAVQFEERDGQKIDKEEVSISSDIVIDAGFADYITQNWDSLTSGETLKFDFASVSQMDMIKLQVKMTDMKKTSAKNYLSNNEVVMFKMTLASPILKMFIKPIEIGYYKDSRQLAFYKGVSNLKDLNGKQYSSVRIEYSKASHAG